MYHVLARVYDRLQEVDYEAFADYYQAVFRRFGCKPELILDLGCGTGNVTLPLANRGYDMIGLDSSVEMLEIAMEKRLNSGHDILYLLQDMREFELYGTVRAVLSVCDSVNYVTDEEELQEVFRLVNNYLDPQGIFIFDFNTEYKYREVLGDGTFAEEREECSFIWDNYYDQEEQINEYELTLFVKCRQEEDLYRKYQEVHFQRAYTLEEIKTLIEKSGLTFLNAYDDYTRETATEESERIVVVCRECGKGTKKKV